MGHGIERRSGTDRLRRRESGIGGPACTVATVGKMEGQLGELVRILTTVTLGTNLLEHAVIDVEDLAARIEKLYRQPDLAKQYSDAGLEFARSLRWETLVPQWLQVISSAAGVEISP